LQRDVVIKVLSADSGLDSDWMKAGQEIDQIKIVYQNKTKSLHCRFLNVD